MKSKNKISFAIKQEELETTPPCSNNLFTLTT